MDSETIDRAAKYNHDVFYQFIFATVGDCVMYKGNVYVYSERVFVEYDRWINDCYLQLSIDDDVVVGAVAEIDEAVYYVDTIDKTVIKMELVDGV